MDKSGKKRKITPYPNPLPWTVQLVFPIENVGDFLGDNFGVRVNFVGVELVVRTSQNPVVYRLHLFLLVHVEKALFQPIL